MMKKHSLEPIIDEGDEAATKVDNHHSRLLVFSTLFSMNLLITQIIWDIDLEHIETIQSNLPIESKRKSDSVLNKWLCPIP